MDLPSPSTPLRPLTAPSNLPSTNQSSNSNAVAFPPVAGSPASSRPQSFRRHTAALNFLSSISLGREVQPPTAGPLPFSVDPIATPHPRASLPNQITNPSLLNLGIHHSPEESKSDLVSSLSAGPSTLSRINSARDEAAAFFLSNISLNSPLVKKPSVSGAFVAENGDVDPLMQLMTPASQDLGPNVLQEGNSKLLTPQPSDAAIAVDTKLYGSLPYRPPFSSAISSQEFYTPSLPSSQPKSAVALKRVNVIYSRSFKENHASLIDELSNSPVMFTTAGGQPFAMFSCLRYHDDKWKQKQKRQKMKEGPTYMERLSTLNDNIKKKKPESFAHLLGPAGTLSETSTSMYDPNSLDDPELRTGKHRTVISLPCLMGSIIQYTKPADLKKELNERFRERHPDIDSSLKLSHIRGLKRKLLNVALQEDLEISSLAKSYVYFEKLVMKGLVNKANRKLYAAICLFLATKVNEPKGMKFGSLLEAIYKSLSITPKEVRDHEFSVFASLEFTLYLPRSEFLPHFERIFATLDYNNIEEYLGDNAFFFTK